MMGNFFNRMYYGKDKGDYTKDDLPDNRWALFFSMLKLNFGKLVGLNLLFLLFFLPMYFWIVQMNIPLMAQYMEAGQAYDEVLLIMIWGMIPCFLILGPGVVGMTYVTRNMARDQNVWVWKDFFAAVKENWKQMLTVSLLNGVLLLLFYVAVRFYSQMAASSQFFYLPYTLMIVMGVLWAAMNLYIWPLMINYELKMKELIKNSALMVVGRLPQTLFMAIFTCLLPALLLVVGSVYYYIAVYLIYVLCGFAVTSMAINSITTAIFDRYINHRIKGAKINQGLRVAYDEETEEEGTDADEVQLPGDDKK